LKLYKSGGPACVGSYRPKMKTQSTAEAVTDEDQIGFVGAQLDLWGKPRTNAPISEDAYGLILFVVCFIVLIFLYCFVFKF